MNRLNNDRRRFWKRPLIIIPLLFLGCSVIAGGVAAGVLLSKNKNDGGSSGKPITPPSTNAQTGVLDQPLADSPIFSEDDIYRLDDDMNTNEYFLSGNSINIGLDEKNLARNINTKFYDTSLMKEWRANNYFASRNHNGYPAYDFNWAIIKGRGSEYQQNFIKKYYDAVVNEKAESDFWTNDNKTKFNSQEFIRNEIKNNNLKKHPASEFMHDPKFFIKDSTLAISKKFAYLGFRESLYNTGMYAAPGEIITLELTPDQFEIWKNNNFKGITLSINHQSFDQPRGYNDSGMAADRYPYTQVWFNFSNIKYGTPTSTISDSSDWIYEGGIYKYQFGSPFGGSIAVKFTSSLKINGTLVPLKFKISGGIEEVHYLQGQTTEQEWNDQIAKVMSGEITSPMIAIDSFWFNASCNMYNKYQFSLSEFGTPKRFKSPPEGHVYSTKDLAIGGYGVYFTFGSEKRITDLSYPYDMVKKWDTFIMLSSFSISADVSNSPYKEIMRFGPEVWGGAAGWGGSYQFWTFADAFTQMFFSGEDVLCATGNWLGMHEINHGYEAGNWNFNNLPHGVTNQITTLNLSVIGDIPRYRNIFNINGEWGRDWSRMTSPFSNVKGKDWDAYTVFSDYLFTMGTGKTLEYIRWQSKNAGKNGNLTKGGINEIFVISKFASANFYYALRDIYAGQNWLPISKTYEGSTAEEKKIIDKLTKELPSIDIVANLYASGTYLYDPYLKDYVYTNDTVPAFEIPAGIDSYAFDFEKGITSKNSNFQFKIKSFETTTKLGGKLTKDPNNDKILIYTPQKFTNVDDYAKIDEFNLEIEATHNDKYPNYVPGYKYKIKIRQNSKATSVLCDDINYVAEKSKFVENRNNQVLRAKFIAAKSGNYLFKFKNLQKLQLTKDGSTISPSSKITLNQGDVVDVTYSLNGNERTFDIDYYDANDNIESINFFSNVLSPYLPNNQISLSTLNNKNINYKPRTIASNGIGYWAKHYIDQPYEDQVWKSIDPSKMNITYTHGDNVRKGANTIKYGNNSAFRISYVNQIRTLEFQYTFTEPVDISTAVIYAGANGFYMWRPKGMKFICKDVDGNIINVTDDEFVQYKTFKTVPYDNKYVYYKFPKTAKNIVEMEVIVEKETGQNCLDIEWINLMSNDVDSELNNIVPADTSFIKYSSDWISRTNDLNSNEHYSIMNNNYKYTQTSNSTIEFKLYGNGFTLIGQNPRQDTFVDVYVDGSLVMQDHNIKNTNVGYGQNILKWFFDSSSMRQFTVKVVLKNNAPLYLDGIGISALSDKIGRIIKI